MNHTKIFYVGSSYIKLQKERNHPKKALIYVQNIINNDRSKWCLVIYVHPTNQNPKRIRKVDKF